MSSTTQRVPAELPGLVADWFAIWLNGRAVSPERRIADERRYHQYIEPKFGDLLVTKVTERLVQNWLHNDKVWGGKEATKYATLMILRQVLELPAHTYSTDGHPVIRKNPASGVRLEEANTGLQPVSDVLYRESAERLVGCMTPHYQPLALLALRLGVTWAEAMGLTVDAVDIRSRRIMIGRLLGIETAGVVEVRPRTSEDAPERSVDMPQDLQRALAAYLVETQELRDGFPYLFVTPNAKRDGTPRRPLRPNWNRYVLRPALEAAGLPVQGPGAATFHTLRHTAARNLLQDGTSLEEVQRILGHKALNTTKRYYQAFIPVDA